MGTHPAEGGVVADRQPKNDDKLTAAEREPHRVDKTGHALDLGRFGERTEPWPSR